MKTSPSKSTRSIGNTPPDKTYSFGFSDFSRGFAGSISNGRLVEKTKRRNIFLKRHNICGN